MPGHLALPVECGLGFSPRLPRWAEHTHPGTGHPASTKFQVSLHVELKAPAPGSVSPFSPFAIIVDDHPSMWTTHPNPCLSVPWLPLGPSAPCLCARVQRRFYASHLSPISPPAATRRPSDLPSSLSLSVILLDDASFRLMTEALP